MSYDNYTIGLAAGTMAMTLVATACGGPQPDALEEGESPVSGTIASRSLVVTDPEVLARFSFARTMTALRTSIALARPGSTMAADETNTRSFQRWMTNFGDNVLTCQNLLLVQNGFGMVCPRPEEKLATQDPFAANAPITFEPVGLFNRFDLMPSDGRTCGEFRIVYAMRLRAPTSPSIAGRGFLIFEAVLPNPSPATGVDGCLGVARFWQALSNDASVTSRASKLDQFYYAGGAVPGFGAVVDVRNYGMVGGANRLGGQVRTNMFVDGREWNLSEFTTVPVCGAGLASCRLNFLRQFVATNPADELFAGTDAKSANFRERFTAEVARLAASNLNDIAMSTSGPGYNGNMNEVESSAQSSAMVYRGSANADMRAAIQGELTRIGSSLTVDNILDRATTQTCGGCHQLSAFRPLGGGLTWPPSRGFVHIDEFRNLSPALTQVFLPRRLTALESFINDRETALNVAPPEFLLLGGPTNLVAHLYDLGSQFCAPGHTAVSQELFLRATVVALSGDRVVWADNLDAGSGTLVVGQSTSNVGPVDDTHAVHFNKETGSAPEAYEAGDQLRFDVEARYTCQAPSGSRSSVTRFFTTGAVDAAVSRGGITLHADESITGRPAGSAN